MQVAAKGGSGSQKTMPIIAEGADILAANPSRNGGTNALRSRRGDRFTSYRGNTTSRSPSLKFSRLLVYLVGK